MKIKNIFSIAILSLSGCTSYADEANPKKDLKANPEAVNAKQTLSQQEKEHLKKIVTDNKIIVSATLGKASFTGAAYLHEAKVTVEHKGKLNNGHLFSHYHDDKDQISALVKGPKNPLPKVSPGDYVIIVSRHEIINSFPGNQKKSYNYFIQKDGKKHCIWPTNSPEAIYIHKLSKM